jgi:hypothetical protein
MCYSLSPKINDMFDFIYVYQCTTLIANIFNYLLLKIIEIVYFEDTGRDKSNKISYANICMYILIEKYGQSRSNK